MMQGVQVLGACQANQSCRSELLASCVHIRQEAGLGNNQSGLLQHSSAHLLRDSLLLRCCADHFPELVELSKDAHFLN